ncbi:hypothetical protein BG53_06860 [Paenibacillus darwinianus]|uniref:DUF58 domain-containing protein n=1 Tax=Paenibacillus darwinianus TaxID=1380763 RepID=A0A9W5S070_9BACL|nr:DUF58 domain-containing protein [Paenibacillus darwinianus]EXX86202.1 hypothetical protein BG53_06860 [Paenibacillus darwinianus]EXX86604.1 hypothetical protein BG52_06180 [Paenibacillus darwinianus]EXX89321.1 hypothetical protein CH50_01645 [Paenibacillus darwinianus]
METARIMQLRWRLTGIVYVGCSLFLLFQGGKTSFMLFSILNVLIIYLVLGKRSGIGFVKGTRQLAGIGGVSDNVVAAGSRLDVKVELKIPGIWPMPYVVVQDRLLRRGGQSMQFEVSFIPDIRRSGRVEYSTPPLQRGRYAFLETECVTRDIFGLFEHTGRFESPSAFTVLPQTVPIRAWSQHQRGLKGPYSHAASSLSAKETTQINGVREYLYGDRLSRVHWNATAKTGEWKSKEFDRESVPRTVVVLDRCGAAYANPELFELAVSVTASLLEHGLRRETAMGLVSVGATADGFQPRATADQRKLILNHLVDAAADGSTGLYRSLRQASPLLSPGSFVVLVTPHGGEEVVNSMQWLERKGMIPSLIHLPGADDSDPAAGWQKLLRARGWQTFNVRQLQELPGALEGGGS